MRVELPGYFGIVLSLIRDHLDDGLDRILAPSGKAIGDSSAQIDRMTTELGPIDAGIWIDDEVGGIEELLGVAFVACQVHITYIVSHIRMLHRHAAGWPRSTRLTTTDRTRTGIMQHGFTAAAGTPYSPVKIMNAFANHYKHRDQCRADGVDWEAPPPKHPAANTILVIRPAGAEQGSTGNLRTGAEYLSNREYQDMSIFLGHISTWRKGLVHAYEVELMAKNLIPARD